MKKASRRPGEERGGKIIPSKGEGAGNYKRAARTARIAIRLILVRRRRIARIV